MQASFLDLHVKINILNLHILAFLQAMSRLKINLFFSTGKQAKDRLNAGLPFRYGKCLEFENMVLQEQVEELESTTSNVGSKIDHKTYSL